MEIWKQKIICVALEINSYSTILTVAVVADLLIL